MLKVSLTNFFMALLMLVVQLMFHAQRDQNWPTPSSKYEAYYNSFIKDNKFLLF